MAEKLPSRQIRFGTGGGFTGKTSTFVLLENGQIFEQNIFGNGYLEKTAASKKAARSLFKKYESLPDDAKTFSRTANFYYFLESRSDSTETRAIWGDENFPAPKSLVDLFFEFNKLVFSKPIGVKS